MKMLYRPLIIICCVMILTQCMSLHATKRNYSNKIEAQGIQLNGASIRLQLKPEGTSGGSYAFSAMIYAAAFATLDGPFKWRIEAVGEPKVHEWMMVHSIQTTTSKTKRSEQYPTQQLRQQTNFLSALNEKTSYSKAIFNIPGLLEVKPREDGELTVLVDVSVKTNRRTERKTIRFHLAPTESKSNEFIFIPKEIVESIGKPLDYKDDKSWN